MTTGFLNYANWYWFIGADQTQVYSSAKLAMVPVADPDYVAWTGSGGTPSNAATINDIEAACALTYPAGTLISYNAYVRYNKASGGCTIGGKPYLTDPVARNTVDSAHNYAVANPGHITDWKLADGTFIQLDEPGLAHVLQEMATFVQSCFTCESSNHAAINGGTITTLAQIDTAFAAISNVLP